MSADVTSQQVYNKKKLRSERQIFYTSNGKLVVHYTYPHEYWMTTNSLGEASVYEPSVNEVTIMTDKNVSLMSEVFMLFLTPNYTDLNLTKMGFILKESKREGNRVVKTIEPTSIEDKAFSKAIVVSEGKRPLYSAFYDNGGKVVKKTYFSHYVDLPMVSFPTRVTQIAYGANGDSTIRKEEYKNIRTSDFPADAPFNYTIPANAKRVKPFGD